jgi:putative endonuclease
MGGSSSNVSGPTDRSTLGRAGEDVALDHYRRRGFELVARNWRCRVGELDLVLRRGGLLVFCEVKARRGDRLGGPFEAVDGRKQRKLRSVAEAFLVLGPAPAWVRFDVASVTVDRSGRPQVHLFEDAF